MTDEKIMKHFENMVKLYDDALPDPEQEPFQFAYYVKLYKYYHYEEYEYVQIA